MKSEIIIKTNSRKRSLNEITLKDFFNDKNNINSIKSINEYTIQSMQNYVPYSDNDLELNNLILTENDLIIYYIIFSKKIIKLKNICKIINSDKTIKSEKINCEKFLIFLFSFIHNKNFNNIIEIKEYKNIYFLSNKFFDQLFQIICIYFLKNNLIKIGFYEIIIKLQFFFYKNTNNFIQFIDIFINNCLDIEKFYSNIDEYNIFIEKIFSFFYYLSLDDNNLFYSFSKYPKIFKLLKFNKISEQNKIKISFYLKSFVPFKLNFEHMKYLFFEVKKLLLKSTTKNLDILFINDIFKSFNEIYEIENNDNTSIFKINNGIIFLGNKNIYSQIKFDNIFLKNKFAINFSFLTFDISNIQVLFSLTNKNDEEVFSIILEKNILYIKNEKSKIKLNSNIEIKNKKEYFVCIIFYIAKIFQTKIDIYFHKEQLNKVKMNVNIIEKEKYSIVLGYKNQKIKNIEKANFNNFKGILGPIYIINEKVNQNNLKNLYFLFNEQLFPDFEDIQNKYYGIKIKNPYTITFNNTELMDIYSSIILRIDSVKINNFFIKKKNKNMNDYIIFKNNNLIEWFLINEGINFITLVFEYFYNLIFNSKELQFEKEM